MAQEKFIFKPLTQQTWKDFESLFGVKGACGGCWCMTWRLRPADYEATKGEGNKKLIRKLVKNNSPLGIIAYSDTLPVGWCSISPKNDFARINNSRTLKTVDDSPVWSVVCFYIKKEFRNKGLSRMLLMKSVEYAKENGAAVVESYPVKPKENRMPDVFAFTGFYSVFKKFGFKEVHLTKAKRPVMRLVLTVQFSD